MVVALAVLAAGCAPLLYEVGSVPAPQFERAGEVQASAFAGGLAGGRVAAAVSPQLGVYAAGAGALGDGDRFAEGGLVLYGFSVRDSVDVELAAGWATGLMEGAEIPLFPDEFAPRSARARFDRASVQVNWRARQGGAGAVFRLARVRLDGLETGGAQDGTWEPRPGWAHTRWQLEPALVWRRGRGPVQAELQVGTSVAAFGRRVREYRVGAPFASAGVTVRLDRLGRGRTNQRGGAGFWPATHAYPTMIQREVRDPEGTTWSCVQALSGVAHAHEGAEDAAERLAGAEGEVAVVATPGGGAQTVRLSLPKGWDEGMSDDELVAATGHAREG